MQGGKVLALVFVDPLHLDIEEAGRVDEHTTFLADRGRQPFFGLATHPLPALQEGGVLGQGLQALEGIQIPPPALAQAGVEQVGQGGIGDGEPAAGGDPVGDVGKSLWPKSGEIMEQVLAQQFAVQLGHPIHLVAADNGQVGHAHPPLGTFLDQGKLFQQGRVAGMAQAHHLEEAGIDFVDDFQLSGQQLLKQFEVPGLKSLR